MFFLISVNNSNLTNLKETHFSKGSKLTIQKNCIFGNKGGEASPLTMPVHFMHHSTISKGEYNYIYRFKIVDNIGEIGKTTGNFD